jgi:glycine/serine hydroxymethyltransferase
MGEKEMDQIGDLIARVLHAPDDGPTLNVVKSEVERLCRRFPLYPERQ